MNANFDNNWPNNEQFKVEIVNSVDEQNAAAPIDDADSRYWDGNASCSSADYDATFTLNVKRHSAMDNTELKKQRTSDPACSPDDGYGTHMLTGINVLLFDGTYYDLVGIQDTSPVRKMGSIIGLCKACPGHVTIKGCQGVSSNFLHHLKQRHPQVYVDFLSKKGTYSKRNRRLIVPMKQTQIAEHSASAAAVDPAEDSLAELSNQSDMVGPNMHDIKELKGSANSEAVPFTDRLLNFFTATKLPLHLVENPYFQELFAGTALTVCSARQLSGLIKLNYTNCMTNIKRILPSFEYYCTTVDIFTDGACSFLAYTCHWLNKQQSYERHSAALVCRRLSNSFAADELNIISNTNNTFQLCNSKVVRMILNNGYSVQTELLDFLGLHDDIVPSVFMNASNVDFRAIPPIMVPDECNTNCSYKSFNEFCSNGLLIAIKQAELAVGELHRETFLILTRLWQRLREYPLTNDCFTPPKDISFTSIYAAVVALLKNQAALPAVCENLFVPALRPDQIEYLQELSEIMSTIFNAFDYLQKPENMYFGYLYATIVSLKVKLKKLLKQSTLNRLRTVCENLISRMHSKFKEFFELHDSVLDAFVAAVTCPTIKLKMANVLRETAPNYDVNSMKQIVLNYAAVMSDPTDVAIQLQAPAKPKTVEDFLDFDEHELMPATFGQNLFRDELEQYLADPSTSINSIQQYPTIERLFLKYNTPLPSSMPVQSLLDFKDILNSAARWDAHFEQQLLYKANSKFC